MVHDISLQRFQKEHRWYLPRSKPVHVFPICFFVRIAKSTIALGFPIKGSIMSWPEGPGKFTVHIACRERWLISQTTWLICFASCIEEKIHKFLNQRVIKFPVTCQVLHSLGWWNLARWLLHPCRKGVGKAFREVALFPSFLPCHLNIINKTS